jgi:hypothetical protein
MNIFEDIRKIIIDVAISMGIEDKNILNKLEIHNSSIFKYLVK